MFSPGAFRLILIFCFFFHASLKAGPLYSPQKVKTWSESGNLSRSPYWHKLLGYKKEWFSYRTAADGNSFFLSDRGMDDPAAELNASIEAFLAPVPENPNRHAICRFPARFHWLLNSLSLQRNRFPEPDCAEYKEFAAHLEAESISYVFASYYSGHPASLFGHTFIKFNRSDSVEVSVVAADPSLSYGARVTSTDPVTYFLDGMFGGFNGTLELQPFRNHLQVYTEGEQRDLWEFRLNLHKEEVDQMIRAAWEMNSTHYDYYFLSENCSYRPLNLLELARPGLDLARDYFWTVHPADTVKQVVDGNSMARSVVFYPATETRYRKRLHLLSDRGQEVMLALSQGLQPSLHGLSEQDLALVHEVAADRVLLQADGSGELPEEKKDLIQRILSQKNGAFDPAQIAGYQVLPQGRNPLIGHESTLISLQAGDSSLGSYAEFRFRPALHDLHDRSRGYSPYGELEFFTARLRVYGSDSRIELQDFVLMNMMSMDPVTTGLWPLAWEVKLGVRSAAPELYRPGSELPVLEALEDARNPRDPFRHLGYGTFRVGLSWEPELGQAEGAFLLYSLAGLSLEGGNGVDSQLAPTIRTGLLLRPFSVWSLRLEYLGSAYSADSGLSRDKLMFYSNLAFTRSLAVEIGYSARPDNGYSDFQASLKYYF